MLEPGIKGTKQIAVTTLHTAAVMESGDMAVFATPAMIALMEQTACRSVAAFLEEGMTTVGTSVNIKHTAATPVGMSVCCESELIEVDGRRLVFKLTACDEKGRIGEGTHERFIVKRDSFQAKTNQKLQNAE